MKTPSKKQLEKAHEVYIKNEPRDLFYKVANDLVSLSLKGKTSVTVAEAISALLLTWNREVYRFKKFTESDLVVLDKNISKHKDALISYRKRSIRLTSVSQEGLLVCLFQDFEHPRGPVGAAKTLHLLAPKFFPLWDRRIAEKGYGIKLYKTGRNGQGYLIFLKMVAKQTAKIKRYNKRYPLKRLDEYNYCKYTKNWI
jgi:hypothetical protein